MAKSIENENTRINLVGSGTKIEGNITTDGDIRVDGVMEGTISAKGKIVVGDSGRLKGELHCKNFEVEGIVEGKIFVSELLSLRSKSKLTGDITTNKLAIEPGANFTGKCDMSGGNNIHAGKPTEAKEEKR